MAAHARELLGAGAMAEHLVERRDGRPRRRAVGIERVRQLGEPVAEDANSGEFGRRASRVELPGLRPALPCTEVGEELRGGSGAATRGVDEIEPDGVAEQRKLYGGHGGLTIRDLDGVAPGALGLVQRRIGRGEDTADGGPVPW